MTTPKVQLTAPPRIWLQVSDDKADRDAPFPASALGYEITWCQDPVLECEVSYVRRDLPVPGDEVLDVLSDASKWISNNSTAVLPLLLLKRIEDLKLKIIESQGKGAP